MYARNELIDDFDAKSQRSVIIEIIDHFLKTKKNASIICQSDTCI